MSEINPTPWGVQEDDTITYKLGQPYDVVDANGMLVAAGILDKGDADMMAAAPALLAALEFALFHIEHRDGLKNRLDLFTVGERAYLRQAVAKAKGEARA